MEVPMHRFRRFLKWIFIPVTLMLVPHSRSKPISFRIPLAGIFVSILMVLVGTAYMFSVSVRTMEYYSMKEQLSRLTAHYQEMKSTMHSLKLAEAEFRKLFGLKSKKDVLEAVDVADTGSLDMDALNKQIREAMESTTDIRKYIEEQKDLYLSTPAGWPVAGAVSSGYGHREHPVTGKPNFHTGTDISVPQGTHVKATADGIVSFSGWTAGSGNTVVIEHGYGFSTAYAHNQRNLVKVGQRVRRRDAIAVSGSTGVSTGPHVHYEIWKNGRHVDPAAYLARG
jgi:murein DD-endopeptidase MepM/ murein hydrolase activator NlpD